jgi:hypothetical protein
MVNLALHVLSGPWVCLRCKNETLETARARLVPAGTAPATATRETATAPTTVELSENADVDPGKVSDEDVPF